MNIKNDSSNHYDGKYVYDNDKFQSSGKKTAKMNKRSFGMIF